MPAYLKMAASLWCVAMLGQAAPVLAQECDREVLRQAGRSALLLSHAQEGKTKVFTTGILFSDLGYIVAPAMLLDNLNTEIDFALPAGSIISEPSRGDRTLDVGATIELPAEHRAFFQSVATMNRLGDHARPIKVSVARKMTDVEARGNVIAGEQEAVVVGMEPSLDVLVLKLSKPREAIDALQAEEIRYSALSSEAIGGTCAVTYIQEQTDQPHQLRTAPLRSSIVAEDNPILLLTGQIPAPPGSSLRPGGPVVSSRGFLEGMVIGETGQPTRFIPIDLLAPVMSPYLFGEDKELVAGTIGVSRETTEFVVWRYEFVGPSSLEHNIEDAKLRFFPLQVTDNLNLYRVRAQVILSGVKRGSEALQSVYLGSARGTTDIGEQIAPLVSRNGLFYFDFDLAPYVKRAQSLQFHTLKRLRIEIHPLFQCSRPVGECSSSFSPSIFEFDFDEGIRRRKSLPG